MDLSLFCCVCGRERATVYRGDAYCREHEQERYRIDDHQSALPDELYEIPRFAALWERNDLREEEWEEVLSFLFASRFTDDLGLKLLGVRWRVEGREMVRDICEMTGIDRKTLWSRTKLYREEGLGATIRRFCGLASAAPTTRISDDPRGS